MGLFGSSMARVVTLVLRHSVASEVLSRLANHDLRKFRTERKPCDPC